MGAAVQRGMRPAWQEHTQSPVKVPAPLQPGTVAQGDRGSAACLGTAGQSCPAFLWGPWALARVIQFLYCQENGISW